MEAALAQLSAWTGIRRFAGHNRALDDEKRSRYLALMSSLRRWHALRLGLCGVALSLAGEATAAALHEPSSSGSAQVPFLPTPQGLRERRSTTLQLDPQAFSAQAVACRGGNQASRVELGRYYEEGVGVEVDEEHARALYQRACDRKVQQGCVLLAVLSSKGSEADIKSGGELLDTACSKGNAESSSLQSDVRVFGRQDDARPEAGGRRGNRKPAHD